MKKIIMSCMAVLVLSLSLASCKFDAPKEGAQVDGTNMVYSNLSDETSKKDVQEILSNANVESVFVENLFAAVDAYNELDTNVLKKEGFQTSPLRDLDYPGIEWPGNLKYYDANCRITAFSLLRNRAHGQGQQADRYAFYDQEVVQNNPWYQFSESEQNVFFSLFNAVSIEPTIDQSVVQKTFLSAWKDRNITFDEGPLSLISVVIHSELDNTAYVGHCGVLVDTTKGLLFIEKYGPSYPYQATKIQNRLELETYLMSRFQNFYTEGISAKPFILENDRLFNPNQQ